MATIKNALFAAVTALAIQAVPAIAQSNDTIEVFTRDDLRAALDANEASYEPNSDGRTIDVEFANGIRANAAVMACDDEDTETECHATSILSTYGAPDVASATDIAEAITQYNNRENFGRAYLDPNGRISVRIYIISDGGITRENYRRQIELWAISLGYFVKYLYERADQEGETAA